MLEPQLCSSVSCCTAATRSSCVTDARDQHGFVPRIDSSDVEIGTDFFFLATVDHLYLRVGWEFKSGNHSVISNTLK